MNRKVCIMITVSPDDDKFLQALAYLKACLAKDKIITQIFFYAKGVVVASLDDYPKCLELLVELTDDHHIDLFVCSAAFQLRALEMSQSGHEDFKFMGLGQFVTQSSDVDEIGVF